MVTMETYGLSTTCRTVTLVMYLNLLEIIYEKEPNSELDLLRGNFFIKKKHVVEISKIQCPLPTDC